MTREVIIIGSGPAGYTAAIYTARAGLKPLLIAGSIGYGGALMQTTEIENFPGFPTGIDGPELMGNMRAQCERFGTEIIYEDVIGVELAGDVKVVRTDEASYEAKAVIVATGSAYRQLGLEREEELLGHGVSYCATCDGFFFKNRPIVVVGGGDSAMEEATFLTRFGSSVHVIHRRDSLRASKAMQERAFADPKLTFVFNSEVVALKGEDNLESIVVRNNVDGTETEMEAGAIFVAIGHLPRTDLFKDQLDLTPDGYIAVTEPSTRTSLPGVFACGDVVDNHYRQAITAAGSGCRAALDAEHYLAAL